MTVFPLCVLLVALYCYLARWLPASNNWVGKWARPLRRWLDLHAAICACRQECEH